MENAAYRLYPILREFWDHRKDRNDIRKSLTLGFKAPVRQAFISLTSKIFKTEIYYFDSNSFVYNLIKIRRGCLCVYYLLINLGEFLMEIVTILNYLYGCLYRGI